MRTHLPLALLLALTLLLLIAGCKEDEPDPTPKLPAETQTGAGTLGFKIGDKIYVSPVPQFVTEFEPGGFDISGGGPTAEGWTIGLSADSITGVGMYRLDTLLIPGTIVPRDGGIFQDTKLRCYFGTNGFTETGTMELTKFDRANRIISGRFSFRAKSNICGNVEVTEGRFDVKF
jgi:hypothetical protein